MQRRIPTAAWLYPAVALLFLFLFHTDDIRRGLQESLRLCYLTVIPSIFPFAVLSGYIMGHTDPADEPRILRPLAHLLGLPPGGIVCFFIGMFCGFPLGAKCIADGYRRGLFSKKDAERMLMFSNNTSPAFLVGGVGGMLGSARAGWSLFGIQALLAVSLAMLTKKRREAAAHMTISPSPISLTTAVRGGVNATLSVVGFVMFFSACIAVLQAWLPISWLLPIACLLEVSTASRLAVAFPSAAIWIAFAVCQSGMSVHLQTAALLEGTDLSLQPYLIAKFSLGVSATALAFVIF